METINIIFRADLTNTSSSIDNPQELEPIVCCKLKKLKTWSLYIIEDKHGRFYTGITTDVQARFLTHQSGKGAKALRGKLPLKLMYDCIVGDRSLASQYEYRVKQLSKQQKQSLIYSNQSVIEFFLQI